MDKPAVRVVLEQIAASLALKGDNPFRIRAFENAASAIATYPGDLAEALQSGALAELDGVGKATLEIVRELLSRGRSTVLDELRNEVPSGLVEMLKIPGLGVQKVRQIHEQLHITTLADLEVAARDGRLAEMPRFGTKTAANVLKGIAFLKRSTEFRLFHHARAEAVGVQQALAALPGVRRVEIAVLEKGQAPFVERAPRASPVAIVVDARNQIGVGGPFHEAIELTVHANDVLQATRRIEYQGFRAQGPVRTQLLQRTI